MLKSTFARYSLSNGKLHDRRPLLRFSSRLEENVIITPPALSNLFSALVQSELRVTVARLSELSTARHSSTCTTSWATATGRHISGNIRR